MLDQLWIAWLFPAPFLLLFWYRYFRHRKEFENKDLDLEIHSPFIIFQITTKGGSPIVARVIERVREVCSQIGYANYRVDVLTDDPRDFYDANMIRTPRGFESPHRSRFKSRALHYAVLWRRARGDNTADKWIFHLDEESFPTTQTIISVLKHITGSNPTPISEGPIVYSNGIFDGSFLTRFSEAVRPFICYDCVHQMSGSRIPLHMHGSNLLVRSDIEDRIGWDFGTVASEDQRFGQEAHLNLISAAEGLRFGPEARSKFGISVFGWHGGLLHEQPPLTVKSWVRQRQRWFIGNVFNLQHSKIPRSVKARIVARLITWMAGFPAGLISIAALFFPQDFPLLLRALLGVVTVGWVASFQVGMRMNLRPTALTNKQKRVFHLELLVLTPLVGLIETYSAVTAPLKIRNWQWIPTEKQNEATILAQATNRVHVA